MVRFSYRMVPEVYQVFWAGMAAGEFINDAAIAADPVRGHTVDPDPVTVGPVGHAGGEADQSGFGGTVLR